MRIADFGPYSVKLVSPSALQESRETELALLQKAAKSSSHHFLVHQVSFGHTGPPQFIKTLKRAIKTVCFAWI